MRFTFFRARLFANPVFAGDIFAGPYFAGPFFATLLLLTACGEDRGSPSPVEAFAAMHDVRESSPELRRAGLAVVRLSQASGGGGTGSFVRLPGRNDAVLMTNHHVIGKDDCFATGCEVTADFHLARGQESLSAVLNIVPLAANVEADVSFFTVSKASDLDGNKIPFAPHVLEFSNKNPQGLLESSVHIIGHPKANLKKWTEGRVLNIDGDYFGMSNFILPGSSGSPILNALGKVVGIAHHTRSTSDIITPRSMATIGWGTATNWLLEVATAAPEFQLAAFGFSDKNTEVSAGDALAHFDLYKNAKLNPKLKKEDAEKGFLTYLAEKCEEGIAAVIAAPNKASLDLLHPCTVASHILACGTPAERVVPYQVCVDGEAKAAWQARFLRAATASAGVRGFSAHPEQWLTTPFWKMEIEKSDGQKRALENLLKFYNEKKAHLTLSIASQILGWEPLSLAGPEPLFAGKNLKKYVLGYKQIPGCQYELADVGFAFFSLYRLKLLNKAELRILFDELMRSEHITLSDKLFLEEAGYERDLFEDK